MQNKPDWKQICVILFTIDLLKFKLFVLFEGRFVFRLIYVFIFMALSLLCHESTDANQMSTNDNCLSSHLDNVVTQATAGMKLPL